MRRNLLVICLHGTLTYFVTYMNGPHYHFYLCLGQYRFNYRRLQRFKLLWPSA